MRSFLILLAMCSSASAFDQGYFTCMALSPDHASWFKTVDNCCDIADGMPTRFEDRADGVYVPPFSETKALAEVCKSGSEIPTEPVNADHSHWVKIPYGAERIKNNPIGIAVVWWTNSHAIDTPEGTPTEHSIRCFVNTLRS